MTPAELSRTLLHTVRCAVGDGEFPEVATRVLGRFSLVPPRPGGYGDYASNAPLQLASALGRPAPELARLLGERLLRQDGVREVRVTGPGFLNIVLEPRDRASRLVRDLAVDGPRYGYGDSLAGRELLLRVAEGELRGTVLAGVVERLVAAQGGKARTSTTSGERLVNAGPTHLTARTMALLGPDALRWDLLHTAAQDRPRLDAAALLLQRIENPLFRVRYAHARTRVLVTNAAALGYAPEPGEVGAEGDALVRLLLEYPAVLRIAAARRAPDRLARHLVQVADALLDLHDRCHGLLPLGGRKPTAAHRSRLALAEAAGTVLAGGLSLLGVSAPAFV